MQNVDNEISGALYDELEETLVPVEDEHYTEYHPARLQIGDEEYELTNNFNTTVGQSQFRRLPPRDGRPERHIQVDDPAVAAHQLVFRYHLDGWGWTVQNLGRPITTECGWTLIAPNVFLFPSGSVFEFKLGSTQVRLTTGGDAPAAPMLRDLGPAGRDEEVPPWA